MYQPSTLDRELARLAHALGHPTRVHLVRRLASEGRLTVRELVAGQDRAQSTVSQHLAILREDGVVLAEPHGREVYYTLHTPSLRRMASLVAMIATQRAP